MVRFGQALQALCLLSLAETASAFSTTGSVQRSRASYVAVPKSPAAFQRSIVLSNKPRGAALDDEARAAKPIGNATVSVGALVAEPEDVFDKTSPNTDTISLVERNVEAVLAASGDAILAAEASLPVEVKKGLNSFGNGTEIVASSTDTSVDIVPAEDVVGEPETKAPTIEAPPVLTILKFAVPAVGVWLCSPVLSLIDTSAVGILSGTVQQAALNPAVAITDYAALLIVRILVHLLLQCTWSFYVGLNFLLGLSFSGVFVHGNHQHGCISPGNGSYAAWKTQNNGILYWCHAAVDLCRTWAWNCLVCLCKAFAQGYHWQ